MPTARTVSVAPERPEPYPACASPDGSSDRCPRRRRAVGPGAWPSAKGGWRSTTETVSPLDVVRLASSATGSSMVRRQPVDGVGVRAGGTAGRVVTDWNLDGARPMPVSAHVAQAAEAARERLARLGPLRTADDYARPMILGIYRLWELTERGEALSALVRADDSSGAALAELRELLDVMGAVADLIACQASRCVARTETVPANSPGNWSRWSPTAASCSWTSMTTSLPPTTSTTDRHRGRTHPRRVRLVDEIAALRGAQRPPSPRFRRLSVTGAGAAASDWPRASHGPTSAASGVCVMLVASGRQRGRPWRKGGRHDQDPRYSACCAWSTGSAAIDHVLHRGCGHGTRDVRRRYADGVLVVWRTRP